MDRDAFEDMCPAFLRQLVCYDCETGGMVWKIRPIWMFPDSRSAILWNGRFAGKAAFDVNTHGYKQGTIFYRKYPAHRVAWALHSGEWPQGQIDHINGDKSDNRIKNLRVVSNQQNARNSPLRSNNTTGVLGVYAHRNGRYYASITVDGSSRSLGGFADIEAATSARKAAEKKFGFHENHGRKR